MKMRVRPAIPGRRAWRLECYPSGRWIEWRPRLGVWDVLEIIDMGFRRIPKRVHRTPDFFDAVGRVMEMPC